MSDSGEQAPLSMVFEQAPLFVDDFRVQETPRATEKRIAAQAAAAALRELRASDVTPRVPSGTERRIAAQAAAAAVREWRANDVTPRYALVTNAKDPYSIDTFVVALQNGAVPALVQFVINSGIRLSAGHVTLDNGLDGFGKLAELWRLQFPVSSFYQDEFQFPVIIDEFSKWVDDISTRDNALDLDTAPPMFLVVLSITVSYSS